jgi:two-component system chemotaxis response regulator CheB
MDGETFLRHLMGQKFIPTVIISDLLRENEALKNRLREVGALEFVPKPDLNGGRSYLKVLEELQQAVKRAASHKHSHGRGGSSHNYQVQVNQPQAAPSAPSSRPTQPAVQHSAPPARVEAPTSPAPQTSGRPGGAVQAIVVGSSTGGTEALVEVLRDLPANTPGVVVVQHMPAWAIKSFVQNLSRATAMKVSLARNGQQVITGQVLIAPGDRHIRLRKVDGKLCVQLYQGPRVSGHLPSVDVLMSSAAEILGRRGMGIMLTGMGSDGAQGMLAMRQAGACTVGQDEATCVVYGMPREAARLGAVQHVLPLPRIGPFVQKKVA